MKLAVRLKHHFLSTFRELFVHHHGSLEFRAKIYALVIAVDKDATVDNYVIVKKLGLQIYKDDEDRANLLMMTTKEKVKQVKKNHDLCIDTLVASIQKDLKIIPRYAKKIDVISLKELLPLSFDEDTVSYQNNILEFLETLKSDTLKSKEKQINEDERTFNSKFI